jgi:hypothetical protein
MLGCVSTVRHGLCLGAEKPKMALHDHSTAANFTRFDFGFYDSFHPSAGRLRDKIETGQALAACPVLYPGFALLMAWSLFGSTKNSKSHEAKSMH